uniref:RNA ligase domain-containing protein n=1 Tax=viral metagenome TaxID=1070528 RepID=A0A6C0EJ04_9ZZZZ
MPSINALRQIVRDVEKICKEPLLPKLYAIGTVKLHGTNASILYNNTTNAINPQKKSGIISIDNDNYGFAQFMHENIIGCMDLVEKIKSILSEEVITLLEYITIFGEWAGKGIQQKVAISELPRAFYMFGIHIKQQGGNDYWLSPEMVSQLKPCNPIYNLYNFKTYSIKIDLNRIDEANDLMKIQLDEVENEDPVAKSLGATGIGEGIVYVVDNYKGQRFIWKVKGDKHARTGKIKPEYKTGTDTERESFLDSILPNWRLEQGIIEIFGESKLIDRGLYGNYIKWINQDIIKEEMDRIEQSNYTLEELYKDINRRSINFIK